MNEAPPSTEPPSTEISMEKIKESMRATWMAGDFGVIAKTNTRAAEEFIARLNIPLGARVLDVACGTGNLAIPLARDGVRVTGVDIARNLLVQARERAAHEGLAIDFDEGDAEQLPYPDASFDAVVTMFGAMFAPRPAIVASELARVLRPGGLLAMANWNPGSFTDQMFVLASHYVPPPPGIPAPVLWGDEAFVHERLTPHFTNIVTELVPLDFDFPTSPAGAVTFFRRYFGPMQTTFDRLDEKGKAAFAADLEALWDKANLSPEPATHTLVKNQYLQVTAVRNQP